jgi:5-methylcytosine-specific restriction endonuclease McrA
MIRDKEYGLVSCKRELEILRRLNKEVNMMRVRRCRYRDCHAYAEFPNHYCAKHIAHEAEYLASRAKWKHTRNKAQTHRYNAVTRNRNDAKREQYNFYRTKQWQSLRIQTLEHQHYICQYCGAFNSKTVDHVVPIEANSKLKADISNLATICRKCHHTKTEWEQSYYGTGNGNKLKDVEPIADINKIVLMMNGGTQNER